MITPSRYFSDTMEAMIAEAKSEGRHERGPINLQATAVHIAKQTVIHREAGTGGALHACLCAVSQGTACARADTGMSCPSAASSSPSRTYLSQTEQAEQGLGYDIKGCM